MSPTPKELTGKVKRAIELISEGKRVFVDEKVHGERDELEDMGVSEDKVFEVIGGFLNEILGYGVMKCWRGASPLMKSYENKIKGCDLWAFQAVFSKIGREMYIKFALKKDQIFVYVSFHPQKGEKK